ncbi:uncharacterized protein LOC113370244 isoform X3 [Ctenocephalides felis]|nr:uncharacterized protein LOC113370244 isoform X3 [Ctenocephalides felis]
MTTDITTDGQFPDQPDSLHPLDNCLSAEIESNSGISSGPVSPNELNESSGISEIKLTEGKKLNNKKKRKLISLECLECGQTFKQQRTFKKHLLRHVKQPLVATQRCDQSQLYSEALRRSTRLSTKPMPAAAGNGLKLKIKLDGSGDGNNFEVVQYEESGTGQLADELSNHSSTATNSVAGENTRDHNLEQGNDESSRDAQSDTSVTNTNNSAQVALTSIANAITGQEEGNSSSNISQNEEVEESLASILSKSIQDDENSSAPAIDPFHGILEEQEEQERAINAGGLRVLTLTPQTSASQSSTPSSPQSTFIKENTSPAYFPTQAPGLPCRLGENVMVELNTTMLTPRSMDSPSGGTSTPPTSSTDHGKLLHQMLSDNNNQNANGSSQSEYIPLDKLPIQHICATCNLGFSNMPAFEEHCRTQGHVFPVSTASCSNIGNTAPAYTQLQTPAQQQQQQQSLFQPQYTTLQPSQYTSAPPPYNGSISSQQQFGTMAGHQMPYGQPAVPMEQLAQQVRNMPVPPHSQQPHNNMGIRYMTQQNMMPSLTSQQPSQQGGLPQPGQPNQPPYGMPPSASSAPISQHQQQSHPQPYSRLTTPYRMRSAGSGPYPQQQFYPQQPQRAPYQRYAPRMVNGVRHSGPMGSRPTAMGPGGGRPLKRPNAQSSMRPAVAATATTGGPKLRKMSDLLLPSNNESDDCSLISVQNADPTLPVIQNVHGNANTSSTLPKEAIRLSDQITLSVRNKEPVAASNNQPRSKEAKAVASILAQRGITVTTGANGRKNGSSTESQESRQEVSLNLNNAVSLIPTNKSGNKSIVATVDLTDDKPQPKEVFAAGSKLLNCQLCNKQFLKQAALNLHVVKNHPSVKLPYRCGECTAKYPTLDGLTAHQRAYHVPSAELGLPVVDLSRQSTLTALANLGISNYVPLSSLDHQAGSYYGIPIVSVQVAQNSASSKLHALGASDILSLGPLKQLPRYQQN